MSRELQEYKSRAQQEITACYKRNQRILDMKKLELVRVELNKQNELHMIELEKHHQRKLMAIDKKTLQQQQYHELQMVTLIYRKEDVQNEFECKQNLLIAKLQILLKTEPGMQKLESLMNNQEFCEKLQELLPDIFEQLCEIFDINTTPVNGM